MGVGVSKVAALYVERSGVYWNLPDVDPWDEDRDARKYAGPYPVVAHPPCERWGRYAGEDVGNDGGCFSGNTAAFSNIQLTRAPGTLTG
jgi:hypothetical protein